jgi:hypothetical protein
MAGGALHRLVRWSSESRDAGIDGLGASSSLDSFPQGTVFGELP